MKTKIMAIVLLSVLSVTSAFAGNVTLSTTLPNRLRVNNGAIGADINNPTLTGAQGWYIPDSGIPVNGLQVEGDIGFGWQVRSSLGNTLKRGGTLYSTLNGLDGITTYLTNTKGAGYGNDTIFIGPGGTEDFLNAPYDQYHGYLWLAAENTYLLGNGVNIGNMYKDDFSNTHYLGELVMYVVPYWPFNTGGTSQRAHDESIKAQLYLATSDTRSAGVIAGDEININPTNGRPGGVINLIAANTYYSGNLVQGSSDLSLKTDIATIPNALEKVCALRGVNFRWKDNILDHSLHIGVVGQEVEKVFPEVVSTHEGKKYVAYEALVGPLIEAVKAQQKEIDALRAEVAALKR